MWIYPRSDYTEMEKEIEAGEPFATELPMFVASGSAKDCSWANHKGNRNERRGVTRKTIVVLSQCPFRWVEQWAHLNHAQREKDKDYLAFKQKMQEVLTERGFCKRFPDLEQYIKHTSVGTPLTTNNFLQTDEGECYGRGASPKRWLCPDFSPYTPIKDFYLTGQDVVTLGIAGATASGYVGLDSNGIWLLLAGQPRRWQSGKGCFCFLFTVGFSRYMTACVIAGYGRWENTFLEREICLDLGLGKLF